MAPKKAALPAAPASWGGSAGAAGVKKEGLKTAAELGVTPGDCSNFLTQMRKLGQLSPDQQECMRLYAELPRFDGLKKQIIASWKSDKSCKWVGQMKKIMTKGVTKESTGFEGHGCWSLDLNRWVFPFCFCAWLHC